MNMGRERVGSKGLRERVYSSSSDLFIRICFTGLHIKK